MNSTGNRVRLATVATAALIGGLLLPASPASAAESDVSLDARCLTDYWGSFIDDGDLIVPLGADHLEVVFPAVLTDNITGFRDGSGSVLLVGPGEAADAVPTSLSVDGFGIDIPDEVWGDAIPGNSTLSIQFIGDASGPPCPNAAGEPAFPTGVTIPLTTTIGPESADTAVLDLRSLVPDREVVAFIDWATERTEVQWGDTIALHAAPGYFTTGPRGDLVPPVELQASLQGGSTVALAPPVVSADGSTATVTLPASRPVGSGPSAPDLWIWFITPEQDIAARAYAGLFIFPPAPPRVDGTTPTLTRAPKLFRTVRADAGDWGPAGVTLSYQWLRNGTVIRGATKSTYSPGLRDYGKYLGVRVTGTAPGHVTTTLTSKAVKVRLL